MKRLVIEQSDEEFYTSHSGIALVGLALNRFTSLSSALAVMDAPGDLIAGIDIISIILRRVMRVIERTIDKKGQMLLQPDIELEGWWTSLTLADQEIIELYNPSRGQTPAGQDGHPGACLLCRAAYQQWPAPETEIQPPCESPCRSIRADLPPAGIRLATRSWQALEEWVSGRKPLISLARDHGKDIAKRFSCQKTGTTGQFEKPISWDSGSRSARVPPLAPKTSRLSKLRHGFRANL
ncbi:hypothetical protein JN12_03830 [Geobacter argillaceus]|uniref:Uncharacterized protein n=1 Tax=Geobacter argillaceus TaxID=345631 RepID=A0A562V6I1_9BACT|nr:hypothetical protein JN12_03830 [Geobacter argillaceus]